MVQQRQHCKLLEMQKHQQVLPQEVVVRVAKVAVVGVVLVLKRVVRVALPEDGRKEAMFP